MHGRVGGCLLMVAAGVLPAQTTASFYNGGGFRQTFVGATGWYFTPTSDLMVTQVGVLDLGDPGFVDPHEVGIFRASDQSELVTTTIGSGLSGELIDGSRFVDITPTFLNGGEQYYIVADNWFNDEYVFGDRGAVSFAPEIAWNGYASSPLNDIFSEVENIGGQDGNLGPNFRFTVVPAPASAGVLAGVGLAWGRRRG